jgi:uncharacterized protein YndB with AHSA1/START domain
MKNTFTISESVEINAPAAKVWKALTDPAQVKQYLFETEMSADWRVGGSIRYRGVWEGKPYEDKGTILEIKPEKLLKSTYYSPASGLEDKPENYNTVIYKLNKADGKTTLTVVQDNIPSKESAEHSSKNWRIVLDKLKGVVEHL